MMLTTNQTDLTQLVLVIALILVLLIILYIIFFHLRFKKAAKKMLKSKKLIGKYSRNSKDIKIIEKAIKESKRYNGKYKSLNHNFKKKFKKFFKNWAVDITYFIALSRKTIDKKDYQVHFIFQNKKDIKKKRIGLDILIDPVKDAKKTYKKVIKALNKYPVTESLFNIMSNAFDNEIKYNKLDKKERKAEIPLHSNENSCLIYMCVTPKAKVRKPYDFSVARIENETANFLKDNPKVENENKELSPEDEALEIIEDVLTSNDEKSTPKSLSDIEFKTLDELENE